MNAPDAHVDAEIGALIDATLPAGDADRVRRHLGACLACRRLHDDLRDAVVAIRDLPTLEPPPGVWAAIEHVLDSSAVATSRADRSSSPGVVGEHRPMWQPGHAWRRVAAAALLLIGSALASGAVLGVYHSSWSIERLAGAPVAGVRTILADGALGEGEWLETDAVSRARLSIGTLGRADVGPGSRVKLVQAGGAERSLRVERGSIDARVWAPPRFFLVETPAATAIDLGCIYTLEVDERGNGVLAVRSGQVELRGHGRHSLVVAGTVAEMRAGAGPGTPYASREDESFRAALAAVDFGEEAGRGAALDRLLAAARAGSTITLWHLLPRVSGNDRGRVFDRLAMLAPPPDGVGRGEVMRLEPRALSRWRTALEPTWSTERVRLWKRAWRALWSAARSE